MSRTTRARAPFVALAALAASVALATPASAHVEVEAEGARALAQNVEISFDAESPTAGITKLEVILPSGITPADVAFKEGPKGWAFTTTARGYVVTGPAVTAGKDAAYAVIVRQLPDAKSLAFKTLQTYSDGRVDRWIELEQSHGGGHGNSAPLLELKPAAAGATPVPATTAPTATAAPTTAAPSTPAPTTSSAAAPSPTADDKVAKESKAEETSPNVGLVIGGLVVLIAAAAGTWWWLRRKGADS
ncbi:DUF1775 domain-containing protein [Streptomyces sp. NBC_00090]|uniref:DUF1775 domain-containing protein n=1 Tax=Streptomyces sp. NBC_00090 TaxID=2903619 RepID=UPI00324D42BB